MIEILEFRHALQRITSIPNKYNVRRVMDTMLATYWNLYFMQNIVSPIKSSTIDGHFNPRYSTQIPRKLLQYLLGSRFASNSIFISAIFSFRNLTPMFSTRPSRKPNKCSTIILGSCIHVSIYSLHIRPNMLNLWIMQIDVWKGTYQRTIRNTLADQGDLRHIVWPVSQQPDLNLADTW